MTFVDTSALLAFLDRDAARHAEVVAAMTDVLTQRGGVTHNYIVIEAEALIHRRYGADPRRRQSRSNAARIASFSAGS